MKRIMPSVYKVGTVANTIKTLIGGSLDHDKRKDFLKYLNTENYILNEKIIIEKVEGKLHMYPHHVQLILEDIDALTIYTGSEYAKDSGIYMPKSPAIRLGLQANANARRDRLCIGLKGSKTFLPMSYWIEAQEIIRFTSEQVDRMSSHTLDEMFGTF